MCRPAGSEPLGLLQIAAQVCVGVVIAADITVVGALSSQPRSTARPIQPGKIADIEEGADGTDDADAQDGAPALLTSSSVEHLPFGSGCSSGRRTTERVR